MRVFIPAVLFAVAALLTVALLMGCEADSAESIIRNVGLQIEGFYMHPTEGSRVVSRNTGAAIESFNVRQTGDALQAIDSNGQVYNGTMGQVVESRASFTLNGQTTAGSSATVSGTFTVEGTTSTMQGTWIEPTLTGVVFGQATVPSNAPPSNPGNGGNGTEVSVSPSSTDLLVGATTSFTASGGDGLYTWRVSSTTLGAITGTSGQGNRTATYNANREGVNTITAIDASGGTASAQARQLLVNLGNGGPPIPG